MKYIIDKDFEKITIDDIKCKSQMKKFYEEAGVKTARYHLTTTLEEGLKFIEQVGYPVVVKPDTVSKNASI